MTPWVEFCQNYTTLVILEDMEWPAYLYCCMGFSLVVVNGGYCLIAVRRLLIVVTSLVAVRGL